MRKIEKAIVYSETGYGNSHFSDGFMFFERKEISFQKEGKKNKPCEVFFIRKIGGELPYAFFEKEAGLLRNYPESLSVEDVKAIIPEVQERSGGLVFALAKIIAKEEMADLRQIFVEKISAYVKYAEDYHKEYRSFAGGINPPRELLETYTDAEIVNLGIRRYIEPRWKQLHERLVSEAVGMIDFTTRFNLERGAAEISRKVQDSLRASVFGSFKPDEEDFDPEDDDSYSRCDCCGKAIKSYGGGGCGLISVIPASPSFRRYFSGLLSTVSSVGMLFPGKRQKEWWM